MNLIQFLRGKLSEELTELGREPHAAAEADYDAVIQRVASRVKKDEALFELARSRLDSRSEELWSLPQGRRQTLLGNSPPVSLLVLFRRLIERSYAARYSDSQRSLELALAAVEVAKAVSATAYLTRRDSADLMAEALAYLGNAGRINSDLRGAAAAFWSAQAYLASGSGDRDVEAVFLRLFALFRMAQGRAEEAAELFDREISLRKLLGDEEELGVALVQRGWVGCWTEDAARTTEYFRRGVRLIREPRLVLQSLHALAETLAREGHCFDAWGVMLMASLSLHRLNDKRFLLQDRWIQGLIRRAAGEWMVAERLLRSVRADLEASDRTFEQAIASLDLACVYAAQARLQEVGQLATEAYAIFKAQGLEQRALTAVIVLQEAIRAERVPEGLTVAVANFLARFPYNKALRFEWRGE